MSMSAASGLGRCQTALLIQVAGLTIEDNGTIVCARCRVSRELQLTRSESDKYEATWSRDGRWVAFSANTGGTVQVWRIPAGGGEEQQMTTGYERVLHLFYSPDGYVQPSHRNIFSDAI
jgi:hypothetical protein